MKYWDQLFSTDLMLFCSTRSSESSDTTGDTGGTGSANSTSKSTTIKATAAHMRNLDTQPVTDLMEAAGQW